MSISVIAPGMLSSFQDLGRTGSQHLGVPVGGAMDSRAHRLANLLAGNPDSEATLEITLTGPKLRFNSACCIAISGADLSPSLNQKAIPNNRPIIIRPDDVLEFGKRNNGARAYLAIHGGIALSNVLGSRSTNLRGQFGGYQGRALKKGDTLALRRHIAADSLDTLAKSLWNTKVYLPAILGLMPRTAIRALSGEHSSLFSPQSMNDFFNTGFRISPHSERMGYRLEGARLKLNTPQQLPSEAISFGSVQVPADGNPIILMADRQTTGGYPKIAHVATVDLPVLAQCMPGEILHFVEIDLDAAQQLDSQREEAFGRLHQTLAPLRELFKPFREELNEQSRT
ncbi:biotin-dependent carboxyltransferase family protein [Paralcaligenes sp. KSB-10]|uniref:5-oxoprolinase subunit C family protein n=1 Tax=Paralcaligenes sp. KSB-10 TaxID=2901142 RepID=UPI001E2A0B7C|nr:biotin-dependent carboxyltransferase family protein [Paralcaligenes sp. KSB-10]UHL62849.1 biotin-dependent carboxyltransferase family protein [Paralcaligenes sp. KSB-10]